MKLVYGDMEQMICFDGGTVRELVVENKKLFFEMVNSAVTQADGLRGKFVLSVENKPVEFSRYADVTLQFAPFSVNRKHLLTKLYAALEQQALAAEHYLQTVELLGKLEAYLFRLAEELPPPIRCQKLAVGPLIRALAPEVEDTDEEPLEKIFSYMELVRELDRDRLFVMINMRTYFSDEEMERFAESVCLHDFHVLLLESTSYGRLPHTKRYTVDEDLCEF